MTMVGGCQLVLNHHDRIVTEIATYQVQLKWPHRMLSPIELQVDPERLPELVSLAKQPRREVALLVSPYGPRVNTRQTSQPGLIHGRMVRPVLHMSRNASLR